MKIGLVYLVSFPAFPFFERAPPLLHFLGMGMFYTLSAITIGATVETFDAVRGVVGELLVSLARLERLGVVWLVGSGG